MQLCNEKCGIRPFSKVSFMKIPSSKWASPVCHQIIRFRFFAIIKHAHPAAMSFHSFPIHFRFSYIFFDWIFQKYPYPHRLFALVLLVSHPSSLCCSHGRRHPRHAMALGQRPLQICQGQGHHVTVRRAGRLGVRAVPAQLGRRRAQRARPPRRCHPFARRKVEHRLFRRGGLRRRRGTESKTVPTTRSEAKRSHGSTRPAGTPRPWSPRGKTQSPSRVGAAQAPRAASTASRNAGSGGASRSRQYPRTSSGNGAQTWRQRRESAPVRTALRAEPRRARMACSSSSGRPLMRSSPSPMRGGGGRRRRESISCD